MTFSWHYAPGRRAKSHVGARPDGDAELTSRMAATTFAIIAIICQDILAKLGDTLAFLTSLAAILLRRG